MLVSFLILLGASTAGAEAVRFDVEVREDVLGGRSWGLAGAYERLAGRIHFEVDPQNSANRIIRDIDNAPVNAAGRVEFSADFYLLKPRTSGGQPTVLLIHERAESGYCGTSTPPPRPTTRAPRRISATVFSCARVSRCSMSGGSSTCPSSRA